MPPLKVLFVTWGLDGALAVFLKDGRTKIEAGAGVLNSFFNLSNSALAILLQETQQCTMKVSSPKDSRPKKSGLGMANPEFGGDLQRRLPSI